MQVVKSTDENFTLCIDQIFVKMPEFRPKKHELVILTKSSEKHSSIKIDDFQFNCPKRPNIKLDMKTQTQIVIEILLDGLLLTKFDFVFIENILNSLHSINNDNMAFIRLIIRAYKSEPCKYRIGSLHMYKESDIEVTGMIMSHKGGIAKSIENETKKTRVLKLILYPNLTDPDDSSIREVLPFISIPHHPLMLEILGYFYDKSNQLYIVLETIPTGTLLDRIYIKKERIPALSLQKIIYGMMHCLGYMNSYGLMHRDISPDNILITEDYECKIFDFGVSRFNDWTEFTRGVGKSKYIAPEVDYGVHYDSKADVFSASKVILELVDDSINERWKLIFYVSKINMNENPKSRLDFIDVVILLESLFEDNLVQSYIDKIKSETNFGNESLSLAKLLYVSDCFKQFHGESNNILLLEFASELIKVGTNEVTADNSLFDFLFLELMLMGGVAFDLDIMMFNKIKMHRKLKYDTNRLLYYLNSLVYRNLSYKKCFLDFDEQNGFFPLKFIPNDEKEVKLAFLYHVYHIVRLENDSGNAVLDLIISILDDDDQYVLNKVDKCTEFYEKSNSLGKKEIRQAVFCALADAGYANMAVNAWKLLCVENYGYAKNKKYIKIAIDYGDQDSKDYYYSNNCLRSERDFEYNAKIRQTMFYIEMGDYVSAFNSFISGIYYSDEKLYERINSKILHTSLGFVYLSLKKFNDSYKCFCQAAIEGSALAKDLSNKLLEINNNKLALVMDENDALAHFISELFLKQIGIVIEEKQGLSGHKFYQ